VISRSGPGQSTYRRIVGGPEVKQTLLSPAPLV